MKKDVIRKPTVLITGGGTGIGAAAAKIFSEQGYAVVLTGRRRAKLEEAAKQLKGDVFIIDADVSTSAGIDSLVSQVLSKVGDVGILVNNAAAYQTGSFADTGDKTWELMWQTNVMGPVRMCRALYDNFKKRGGGIVLNVASTAGLRPVPGASAYVVSKAALISLTENLALEWAKDKIRVNAVCPGIVETPIHHWDEKNEAERKQMSEAWGKMHPLGRAGKSEDIARSIFFMCQPENDWITGAVLPVDGGIRLT